MRKKTFDRQYFVTLLQKHQEADDNSGAVRRLENLRSKPHVSLEKAVAAL